jgi:hypothetical protein
MRLRFGTSARAGVLLVSLSFAPSFASASTDATTGLPVYPGSTIVDTQAPAVLCGITVRGVQYGTDDSAAKASAFFRKALSGAINWTVPAARMTEFLMPGGKTSVRVLGTPAGSYIVYGAFSKPVTESQLRSGLKC